MKDIKLDKNETLLAKALQAASLAEYQEGSVVSRTLIDKKVGTITLFAFAQGQGLSEHVVPYDAFVYILDGQAQITISKKILNLNQGEMVIMPANEPHALKAIKPFKMLLVMIRA